MPNGSGCFDCFNCAHLNKVEGAIEGKCTYFKMTLENPCYSVCHRWMPKHNDLSEQRIKELVSKLDPQKLYFISGMGSFTPAKELPPIA